MGKRPRRNDTTRPGDASSAWNHTGWFRVYHGPKADWEATPEGVPNMPAARRQGGFPRPLMGLHYHRPPVKRTKRDADPMVAMRAKQRELAREIGLLPPLKSRTLTQAEKDANILAKNTAEFAEVKAAVETGELSPVRRKQLRDGFLEAGLDHLLG